MGVLENGARLNHGRDPFFDVVITCEIHKLLLQMRKLFSNVFLSYLRDLFLSEPILHGLDYGLQEMMHYGQGVHGLGGVIKYQ